MVGRPRKKVETLIRSTGSSQQAVPQLVSTSRGTDTKSQQLAWASIFTGCNITDVKEVLLVFTVSDSPVQNVTALEQFSKEKLCKALNFLIADDESRLAVAHKHLTKKGVATAIVKEVHRLLPYKCTGCNDLVQQDRLKKSDIRCLACGLDACNTCSSKVQRASEWPNSQSYSPFICPCCISNVKEFNSIAQSDIHVTHLAKSLALSHAQLQAEAGANDGVSATALALSLAQLQAEAGSNDGASQTVQDLGIILDDTQGSEDTFISLNPGQGTPVNSIERSTDADLELLL